MQKYAEQAVRDHVVKYLQPSFERLKSYNSNFPYIGISTAKANKLTLASMKQSERWRALKELGFSEDSILASFNTKVHMTILKYDRNGECVEEETEMTPRDSILYYKKFLRTAMMAMDPVTLFIMTKVGLAAGLFRLRQMANLVQS